MNPRPPLVRVEQVGKRYREGPQPVQALDGVTLEVDRGEFVAVMGPSGCGKSTLLHLMAGIDRATGGEIWLDGSPLGQMTEAELTRLRREKVGIIYQAYNLLPHLTLWENVALPLLLTGVPWSGVQERVEEVLKFLDLTDRARHMPHQLSGGEMQRTAVGRAIITRPLLLLADEPTGNLDSKAGQTILRLFQTLSRSHGQAVVLATHSPEAAAYADRIIRLRDGRVLP